MTSVDLGWRQGCGEEPLPGQAGPPADTSSRAAVQTLSWEEFLFQVRRLQGTMPTARRPPVTQSKGLSLSGAMAQFSRRARCQQENTAFASEPEAMGVLLAGSPAPKGNGPHARNLQRVGQGPHQTQGPWDSM